MWNIFKTQIYYYLPTPLNKTSKYLNDKLETRAQFSYSFVQPKNVDSFLLYKKKCTIWKFSIYFHSWGAGCGAISYTGVSSSWHCTSISRPFYVRALFMSGSMPTMPLIRHSPPLCRSIGATVANLWLTREGHNSCSKKCRAFSCF